MYSRAAKTIKGKQKHDCVLIPSGRVIFAARGSMCARQLDTGGFEVEEMNILFNRDIPISQIHRGACNADSAS